MQKKTIITLFLLVLLVSCVSPVPSPTATPVPSFTPSPTLTLPPTSTETPEPTLTATATPVPPEHIAKMDELNLDWTKEVGTVINVDNYQGTESPATLTVLAYEDKLPAGDTEIKSEKIFIFPGTTYNKGGVNMPSINIKNFKVKSKSRISVDIQDNPVMPDGGIIPDIEIAIVGLSGIYNEKIVTPSIVVTGNLYDHKDTKQIYNDLSVGSKLPVTNFEFAPKGGMTIANRYRTLNRVGLSEEGVRIEMGYALGEHSEPFSQQDLLDAISNNEYINASQVVITFGT